MGCVASYVAQSLILKAPTTPATPHFLASTPPNRPNACLDTRTGAHLALANSMLEPNLIWAKMGPLGPPETGGGGGADFDKNHPRLLGMPKRAVRTLGLVTALQKVPKILKEVGHLGPKMG